MKGKKSKNMISKKGLIRLCISACAMLALNACKEKIDTSARYVFTDETVISYLEKHEAYSSYVELLKIVPVSKVSETTVAQLLSARGNFTCFAPSNEAIQEYLKELAEQKVIYSPSWDGFPNEKVLDSIRKAIVYNSLLDGGDVLENFKQTFNFPTADSDEEVEFDISNMNDRKLSVKRDKKTNTFFISKRKMSSEQCDILTTNGVVHQMLEVIAPSDISAATYCSDMVSKLQAAREKGVKLPVEETKNNLALCRILCACNLLDTLNVARDEVYEMKYLRGEIKDLVGMTGAGFAEGTTACVPEHRKIGFTIFSEGDEYWEAQGLHTQEDDFLEELTQWILHHNQYSKDDVFISDDKYSNPNHILYQWITYHILPMRIPTDKLVIHDNELGYSSSAPKVYTVPVYEYYTTMGKRRLLKIFESKESQGVFLNRFPKLDNSRTIDRCQEISCDDDKFGWYIDRDNADLTAMSNCIIYPIKDLKNANFSLSYDDPTRDNLFKDRLRFDGMSLFPEAMTNDIRRNKQASGNEKYRWVHIPATSVYPYFKDMYISDETKFVYYNTYENWCNLYEDEMKAVGHYEIMVTLPPVPRTGTYELRYDVLANDKRGVVQAYFGDDINNLPVTGIPIDLTLNAKKDADAALMGWVEDRGDEDIDSDTDHQMRNNGFMKGAKSISDRSNGSERGDGHHENSRRILKTMTMYPDRTYYLKLKTVLQQEKQEFYMDYLELCPKEVYDNPETPEDIW